MCVNLRHDSLVRKKPRLMIYDMDGCVVDSSVRLTQTVDIAALERGDYQSYCNSFEKYNETLDGDVPIPLGIAMVASLRQELSVDRTVALTARGDGGRVLTLGQLCAYMPWRVEEEDLLMRPSRQKDAEGNFWSHGMPKFDAVDYKRGVTLKLMETYDVVCAVDDHSLIIEMYRSLGINAIHMQHEGIDCLSAAGDKNQPELKGI